MTTERNGVNQIHGYGGDAASTFSQRAGDAPLLVLAGGLAVGAVVGALLPRGERERQLLTGVGERVAVGARDAAETAREATVAKLAELGKSVAAGATGTNGSS